MLKKETKIGVCLHHHPAEDGASKTHQVIVAVSAHCGTTIALCGRKDKKRRRKNKGLMRLQRFRNDLSLFLLGGMVFFSCGTCRSGSFH